MNWKKISAYDCMIVLKELEKESLPTLDTKEHSIVYTDGKEELKITYKRIIK